MGEGENPCSYTTPYSQASRTGPRIRVVEAGRVQQSQGQFALQVESKPAKAIYQDLSLVKIYIHNTYIHVYIFLDEPNLWLHDVISLQCNASLFSFPICTLLNMALLINFQDTI